jgi:hypothetical protein
VGYPNLFRREREADSSAALRNDKEEGTGGLRPTHHDRAAMNGVPGLRGADLRVDIVSGWLLLADENVGCVFSGDGLERGEAELGEVEAGE